MTGARWLGLGICLAPALTAVLIGATSGAQRLARQLRRKARR